MTANWLAWTGVCAIAILSLLPGRMVVRTGVYPPLEHLPAYGVTAFLLSLAGVAPLAVLAGMVALAGLLEYLQRFSPGRVPSFISFGFSSLGTIVGCTSFAIAAWLKPFL